MGSEPFLHSLKKWKAVGILDIMDTEQEKHLRRNYFANIIDSGFFGFALGFASFATILPLFVSTMTDSALLIGLIPAIHNMGWQFPQLMTAKKVAKLNHIKPTVLMYTVHERLPFLGLAAVAWFLPSIGTKIGLALTFLLLIWQGLGGGFTANPWISMIGKIIPNDYRATFLGLQTAAASLLASVGAVFAGYIVNKYDTNHGFSLCFLIASGLMVFSWISLSLVKETIRVQEFPAWDDTSLWHCIKQIIRENKSFRGFLTARIISQFCLMAFSFYTVYAVRNHAMDVITAGVMTSTLLISQVVANPILGWLADRLNRKLTLEIGSIAGTLSALLAILSPDIHWFFVVVILSGISSTAFYTIGLAISLDFGTDADRPTYVGMANTLVAPSTILAPLLGGWLADVAGYPATFGVAAAAGVITTVILHFIVIGSNNC